MAAPTLQEHASNSSDEIHVRMEALLTDLPDDTVDPDTNADSEDAPEESVEASPEDDAESLEPGGEDDSDDVAPSESAEADPESEPATEGINTLADLAREFEISEDELLEHLEVPGVGGQAIKLKEVLTAYRNGPDAVRRWSEVQQAEDRLIQLDQQLQGKHSETAREMAARAQVLIDMTNEEFADINWKQLEVEDPSTFVILRQKQASRGRAIHDAVEQLKRVEADRDQAARSSMARNREVELANLHIKMPDWREPEKARAAMTDVQNFLVESGFGPEEIDALNDHRYLLVAYQASQFRKLQQQAPKKIEKLRKLPSTRRSLKSGARSVQKGTTEEKVRQQLRAKLAQSGDERYAAKLMEGLL